MLRYVEGCHVLYSTNTIHMSSQPLLLNLPRLLVPDHLATVNSLELLLDIPNKYRKAPGVILDQITSTFPNVRKLYLHLDGDLFPQHKGKPVAFDKIDLRASVTTDIILVAVDEVYRQLQPHLREFELALQYHIFDPLSQIAQKGGARLDPLRSWCLPTFFRPVVGDPSHAASPHEARGYWIVMGRFVPP
ncbi:hypothetical protein S40293_00245 [Stachybotrys chartarum IBT 40293]|nr:hypothetical protein S40293_00245 [Stachybotrys chartarum IBT 40293]